MKKKFNLIALTDLIFRALAMFGIKITIKLDDVTHWVKLGETLWHDLSNKTLRLV